MAGVDLWFTATGGDARLQVREVQNGVPSRIILAEKKIPRSAMVITGGGHTRVLFESPLYLAANTEYAVVVLCDDAVTALSVAELGKFDEARQRWITSQPYQVGVLLSSSNASTWTAHQDMDLTFRILGADFTRTSLDIDLGGLGLTDCTDLILYTLEERPSAQCSIEYELTLPDGETRTMAGGQRITFGQPVSGPATIKARLTGTANSSPVLWPGTQILEGSLSQEADYHSRSIPAFNATRATLVYEAYTPTGSSITPSIQCDDGEWESPTQENAIPQGDGLVEYTCTLPLSAVNAIKTRFDLSGHAGARPCARNIRLMAVI